jgi:hypothetical protein
MIEQILKTPMVFAVCAPTINCSPPSMKKNFNEAAKTTNSKWLLQANVSTSSIYAVRCALLVSRVYI